LEKLLLKRSLSLPPAPCSTGGLCWKLAPLLLPWPHCLQWQEGKHKDQAVNLTRPGKRILTWYAGKNHSPANSLSVSSA
ncbi:hypothetical protein HGM15179_015224, partial [Zosterops borbonicus]